MSVLRIVVITMILCCVQDIWAQGDRGIRNGMIPLDRKCTECTSVINSRPPEVMLGLEADPSGQVFFVVTNDTWFKKLFSKPNDGICVDVVHKGQFACGAENDLANSSIRQGLLLAPAYFRDFKKQVFVHDGVVAVKVGQLPPDMMEKEYELNLILLRGETLCYYQSFYNLDMKRWKLLETGLYMDSIAGIAPASEIRDIPRQTNILLSKRMKFEIPFEKGKSEYSPKDIQPLYDSLRLTDYHIISAEILAYSSVEGTKERNFQLQRKRANSIVNALNSFQDQDIKADIQTAENWVEFINDMSSIGQDELASLSQEKIKQRLRDPALSKRLEPMLKEHRKAILVLELQRRSKYSSMNSTQVLSLYEQSLLDKNMETALEIQQELFSRIRTLDLSPQVLKDIDIPKQIEYGSLLNNQTAFDYELDPTNVLESLLAFRELEYLLPDDPHISYNICVLETRAWLIGESSIDPAKLLRNMDGLRLKGIDAQLVDKLKVNYHIVNSEYKMAARDYKAKDKSIEFIYKKFRALNLGDEDLLSLSQYFSSYARYDRAVRVLKPEIERIDLAEDILFYYLNLTIIDEKHVNDEAYRKFLLNASNRNKQRFCELFNPVPRGGISLQLFNFPNLKKAYCEICE